MKMAKTNFMLLVLASFALFAANNAENCNLTLRDECDYSLVPNDFPNTVEELKDDCREIKTILKCVIRVRTMCEAGRKELDHLQGFLDYTEKVCEEDSPEFIVVSNNLECIARVGRNVGELCRPAAFNQTLVQMAISQVKLHIDKSEHLTEENEDCIWNYWGAMCPALTIGLHCGEEVKKTLVHIQDNTDGSVRLCSDEVRDAMKPLTEIFEWAILEQNNIMNAIDKKK